MTLYSEPIKHKIAVIGAGISGLACARNLHDAGISVEVFDKGRGVGGRMSTRRGDQYEFDHGCQFFTATDQRFCKVVREWRSTGLIDNWLGQFGTLLNGHFAADKDDKQRYAPIPRMNSVCKDLAANLEVRCETQITTIDLVDSKWKLETDDTVVGRFDGLVVSTPPQQAADLVPERLGWSAQLREREMTPCWTVMVAFKQPLSQEFTGARVKSNPLAWVGNNSRKPGRPDKFESWVLQATPEWSEAELETDKDRVLERLLDAFASAIGQRLPGIHHVAAHRWKYALPSNASDSAKFFDSEHLIGICGDWCDAPLVEGAYLNGIDLADKLVAAIKSSSAE